MKINILIIFILGLILSSCNQNYHITAKPDTDSLGKCSNGSVSSNVISLGAGTASDPYIICNIDQLQLVNDDLTAYYQLGKNIDASETSGWTTGTSGTGFIPIGGCGTDYTDCSIGRTFFSGSFDGCGYTVDSLLINRIRGAVGLFGATTATAVITEVKMTNANITGTKEAGGIVARLYNELSNSYFGGSVTGADDTGGIAGYASSSSNVTNTSANVTVSCALGSLDCGGGIGHTRGDASGVSISGTVSGHRRSGGFAGLTQNSSLTKIRSSVTVNSNNTQVGGLIGRADRSVIRKSMSSGNVTSTGTSIGGFIGYLYESGSKVYDSYATGDVEGAGRVGGFLGESYYGNTYSSFATGNVNGTVSFIGEFIGLNGDGLMKDSFATGNATGGGSAIGGFYGDNDGTDSNTYDPDSADANFFNPAHPVYISGTPWDFTNIWNIPSGTALPSLK